MNGLRVAGLWLPVAAFVAFVLSLDGTEDLPLVETLWDKFTHAGAYLAFGLACLRAWHGGFGRDRGRNATLGACAFAVGFGAADEWRQAYLPGRFASGWDILANAVGVLGAAAIWQWTRRRPTIGATERIPR